MLFSHPLNAGKGKGKGKGKRKNSPQKEVVQRPAQSLATTPVAPMSAPDTLNAIVEDFKTHQDHKKTLANLGCHTLDDRGNPWFYPSPAYPTLNFWQLTPKERERYWSVQAACRQDNPPAVARCLGNAIGECWGADGRTPDISLSHLRFETPLDPLLTNALVELMHDSQGSENESVRQGVENALDTAFHKYTEQERKHFFNECATIARLSTIITAPSKEQVFLQAAQDALHAAGTSFPVHNDPRCILSDMLLYMPRLKEYLPQELDLKQIIDHAIASGSPFAPVLQAQGNEKKLRRLIEDNPSNPMAQYAARAELLAKKTGIVQLPRFISNLMVNNTCALPELKALFKTANGSKHACLEKINQLAEENDGSLASNVAQCMRLRILYDNNDPQCIYLIKQLSEQRPELIEQAAYFFKDNRNAARAFYQAIHSKGGNINRGTANNINPQQAHAACELFSLDPNPHNEEQKNYLLTAVIGKCEKAYKPAFDACATLDDEQRYHFLKALTEGGYAPAYDPFYDQVKKRAKNACNTAVQMACSSTSARTAEQTLRQLIIQGSSTSIENSLKLLASKGHTKAIIEALLHDNNTIFSKKVETLKEHMNDEDAESAVRYTCGLFDLYENEIATCQYPKKKQRLIKELHDLRSLAEKRESNLSHLAKYYELKNDYKNAKRIALLCNEHSVLYNMALEEKDLRTAERHLFAYYQQTTREHFSNDALQELNCALYRLMKAYETHEGTQEAHAYCERLNELFMPTDHTQSDETPDLITRCRVHAEQLASRAGNDTEKIQKLFQLYADIHAQLQTGPVDTHTYLALAEIYLEHNETDICEEFLNTYLEQGGDQWRYMDMQGRLQLKLGNLDLASELLLSAYEQNEDIRPDALLNLFKQYVSMATPEGREQAQLLLERCNTLARGKDRITIGIMHGFLKQNDKADNELRQWPAESEALFHRAYFKLYPLLGSHESKQELTPSEKALVNEGKKTVSLAVKLHPTQVEYLTLLAGSCKLLEQHNEAFQIYEKAAARNDGARYQSALYYAEGMHGKKPDAQKAAQYLSTVQIPKLKDFAQQIEAMLFLQRDHFWKRIPKEDFASALKRKIVRYTNSMAEPVDQTLIRIRCYQKPGLLSGMIKNQEQYVAATTTLTTQSESDDPAIKYNAHLALGSICISQNMLNDAVTHLTNVAALSEEREPSTHEWKTFYELCHALLQKTDTKSTIYEDTQRLIISALSADQRNEENVDALDVTALSKVIAFCKERLTSDDSDVQHHATLSLTNAYYQLGRLTIFSQIRNLLCRRATESLAQEPFIGQLNQEKLQSNKMRQAYTYADRLLSVLPTEGFTENQKQILSNVANIYEICARKGDSHNYYHAQSFTRLARLYSTLCADEAKLKLVLFEAEKYKYDKPLYAAALAYAKGRFGENKLQDEYACIKKARAINPNNHESLKGYTFIKYTNNQTELFDDEQKTFIELMHTTLQGLFPGKSIDDLNQEEQLLVLNTTVWPIATSTKDHYTFSL